MKRWLLVLAGLILPGLAVPLVAAAEQDLPAAATATAPAAEPTPSPLPTPPREERTPAWVANLNPFSKEPLGSVQYAVGVVEIGVLGGMGPIDGQPGVGIHYMERGSLLAQMLLNAGSGAGAGARAVTTGKDQTYTIDTSPRSNAGIGVDLRGGWANFDLFYGIPMGNDRTPWVLDFGMTFGSFRGAVPEKTKAEPYPVAPSRGYFGFVLGAVVPVTKWAQLEPGIRIDIAAKEAADLVFAHLAAVGNIGNRFYVRLDTTYMMGLGFTFGTGVRL